MGARARARAITLWTCFVDKGIVIARMKINLFSKEI
jgi:hypothetical protein